MKTCDDASHQPLTIDIWAVCVAVCRRTSRKSETRRFAHNFCSDVWYCFLDSMLNPSIAEFVRYIHSYKSWREFSEKSADGALPVIFSISMAATIVRNYKWKTVRALPVVGGWSTFASKTRNYYELQINALRIVGTRRNNVSNAYLHLPISQEMWTPQAKVSYYIYTGNAPLFPLFANTLYRSVSFILLAENRRK